MKNKQDLKLHDSTVLSKDNFTDTMLSLSGEWILAI
jgi:hypothetical protein